MPNPKDNEEEDKVAAAYENISKRLEDIRSGKDTDDEKSPEEDEKPKHVNEDELEEWKGPKGVVNDEIEEEDIELRKVKLEHSVSDDEAEESDESDESKESDESEGSEEPVRKWKPEEDDPLDDEEDESKEQEDSTDSEEADEPGNEDDSHESEIKKPIRNFEPEKFEEESSAGNRESDESNEDEKEAGGLRSGYSTEEEKPRTGYFGKEVEETARPEIDRTESESEIRRTSASPDTLDDLAERNLPKDDDDEYFIPNLKKPGHNQGNMEYNTPPSNPRMNRAYNNQDNMDNGDPNNYFSQHQQNPKRANKFHLLILVLIGVAVIGFTVYILKGGFGEISISPQASPSPSPTEQASPTPTPTPEPTITRGDFTVRVLNGTSTTGLAGTVSDKLEELGYETANPGNATNSAFTQTVIRVKDNDDGQTLFERLKLDLAPDYDATQGTLPDSSSNDAEVILGTN